MTTRLGIRFAGWLTALAVLPAHAALITSPAELPGTAISITIGFDGPTGSNLSSPVDVGSGILFSTTGGPGSIGEAPLGAWSLGGNGLWSGGKTFAGVDGDFDGAGGPASMIFDLGGLLVRGVGGFMNFDPDFTYGDPLSFPLPLYVAAYDASGALLEDYDVPVSTPNGFNDGAFYGIARIDADIARFVISGPYAVVDDLTVAAIPEPSTYAMLLAGLGLLGFVARRRTGTATHQL
jgi:hypothetical protein